MQKLVEGEDYYFNEAGLMVLTKQYHLQRGFCCGKGCLHCPFDYENVSEPARTALLKKRNTDEIDNND